MPTHSLVGRGIHGFDNVSLCALLVCQCSRACVRVLDLAHVHESVRNVVHECQQRRQSWALLSVLVVVKPARVERQTG